MSTTNEPNEWNREQIENVNKFPTDPQLRDGHEPQNLAIIRSNDWVTFHVPDHVPNDEPKGSPFREEFIVCDPECIVQLEKTA